MFNSQSAFAGSVVGDTCIDSSDCFPTVACMIVDCVAGICVDQGNALGCCASNSDCGFFDACTPEVCDLITNICEPGPSIPGCCASDSDCGFFDACTPEVCNLQFNVCDPGPSFPGCCASDSDCDDSDVCTIDTCDLQTNICDPPDPIPGCFEVGGTLISIETTPVLLGATQTAASWMIPVIVSAMGIAIVLARKFSKYQPI